MAKKKNYDASEMRPTSNLTTAQRLLQYLTKHGPCRVSWIRAQTRMGHVALGRAIIQLGDQVTVSHPPRPPGPDAGKNPVVVGLKGDTRPVVCHNSQVAAEKENRRPQAPFRAMEILAAFQRVAYERLTAPRAPDSQATSASEPPCRYRDPG